MLNDATPFFKYIEGSDTSFSNMLKDATPFFKYILREATPLFIQHSVQQFTDLYHIRIRIWIVSESL
jgi:hypothetical protein